MSKKSIHLEPSGNSFIDENHGHLLEHLIHLSSLASTNSNLNSFRLIVEDFITNLEQHFSHEETILKGAGYTNLRAHTMQHRMIALELHKFLAKNFDHDEATLFVQETTSSIIAHEMSSDQDYWPYFNETPSSKTGLISWQQAFETGNKASDTQHQSLINHINRFYLKLIDSNDIEMACTELKLLCAYSKHHFQEEEQLLGDRLRLGHKEHHQKLLADLDIVINKIQAGEFTLNNLGDYLDYWLVNHIKMYDIPAFSSN